MRCSQGSPYHLCSLSSFGLVDIWQNQDIWAKNLPLEVSGPKTIPGSRGLGVTGNPFTFPTISPPLSLSIDCVCVKALCV